MCSASVCLTCWISINPLAVKNWVSPLATILERRTAFDVDECSNVCLGRDVSQHGIDVSNPINIYWNRRHTSNSIDRLRLSVYRGIGLVLTVVWFFKPKFHLTPPESTNTVYGGGMDEIDWARYALDYDAMACESAAENIEHLKKRVDGWHLPPKPKVLDIGAGTGALECSARC